MGWKDWSYWLKGGIVGGIISLVWFSFTSVFVYLFLCEDKLTCGIISFFLNFPIVIIGNSIVKIFWLTGIGKLLSFIPLSDVVMWISYIVSSIIVGFIIGAIIGWIYGKIKSRNQVQNQ